jgi:hypothetical protein
MESDYSVEKSATAFVGVTSQRMELRVEAPPEPNPGLEEYFAKFPDRRPKEEPDSRRYISIVGTAPNGKIAYDVLLRYKPKNEAKIDSDWERLTAQPNINLTDLDGWTERVVSHGTGYLRENGVETGIRMY